MIPIAQANTTARQLAKREAVYSNSSRLRPQHWVIVAQLVAPLFGALFGAKVALFGGIFNPLGQIKFDLLNAILNPLGYSLANCTGTAPFTNNATVMKRSLDSLNIIDMIEAASQIYEAMQ